MRRASLEEIQPGTRVARTLHYSHGAVMLPAGARLDLNAIAKLKEFGYTSLYIYDEDTEDVVVYDYIDEKTRLKISKHVNGLFHDLKEETKKRLDPKEFHDSSTQDLKEKIESPKFKNIVDRANIPGAFMADIEEIINAILSDRELSLCVGTIKTSQGFLYEHSIDVAIHAAILAKHFGFGRYEIKEIVLGALLHDIGQIFIPEDILSKKTPLNTREEDILKQHTMFGYYLLKERNDVSLLSAHVAYQHHEQQDGGGYPRGLRGTNKILSKTESLSEGAGSIHRYAAIVAVPDYYDELTSDLPYRSAIPPDQGAAKLFEASGTILNAAVVEAFLSYLPVYPLGTTVVLQGGKYSGWKGVVVGIEPEDLAKPIVRLLYDRNKKLSKPVDIDLREETDLLLKAVWK